MSANVTLLGSTPGKSCIDRHLLWLRYLQRHPQNPWNVEHSSPGRPSPWPSTVSRPTWSPFRWSLKRFVPLWWLMGNVKDFDGKFWDLREGLHPMHLPAASTRRWVQPRCNHQPQQKRFLSEICMVKAKCHKDRLHCISLWFLQLKLASSSKLSKIGGFKNCSAQAASMTC